MPVFDTPITTDDRSLSKIIGQKLPVAVLFYDSRHKPDSRSKMPCKRPPANTQANFSSRV